MTSRRNKLETMLQASPDDQTLRYMLAMELDKESQHSQSLELFQSLMQDPTPYVPAFLMAGQLLARLQRNDEARQTYLEGIQQAQRQNNEHAAGEMAGFLANLE